LAIRSGLNDFIVYGAIALVALGAGEIHSIWGWRAVNVASAPVIIVIVASVAWLAARRSKQVSTADPGTRTPGVR
jgi:hypothetical protein